MFLILGIALLIALPQPWNFFVAGACLVGFVGEIGFWNRRVRRHDAATGVQTLIGRTATVTRSCRPHGQVRIAGEVWEALCEAGADPGEDVRVVAVEKLTLVVEPVRT